MKKIIYIVIILLILYVVMCFVPFNANSFIPKIQEQIQSQYGVTIQLSNLNVKICPNLTLKTDNVKLFYDKTNYFASCNNVRIKIKILPLLKNNFNITNINVDSLETILKFDSDGNLFICKFLKQSNKSNIISKIYVKNYINKLTDIYNNEYIFKGNDLIISDYIPNKSLKFSTKGKMFIDGGLRILYDLSISLKNLNLNSLNSINIIDILLQIRNKNVSFNIVSDMNIKNVNGKLQTEGSLNIDKLTYYINGIKIPNSFIELNLFGHKIQISSTIYTNYTDKIFVNGNVINLDNPTFNLTVKSNQINLKDLYCFTRIFFDISNLEQLLDINGHLCADFALKGTLKHIKSNGYFKIKDANIITSKYKIKNINSDVNLNNNKILINNTKAIINSAPVTLSGTIVSNMLDLDLNINKFRLKNIKIAKCKIYDGVLCATAKISGPYKNIISTLDVNIENILGAYDTIKFKSQKIVYKSDSIKNKYFIFSNLILNIHKFNTIVIPEIKGNIHNNNITIDKFPLYSKSTHLNLYGSISNYNNDKINTIIKGNGFISPEGLCNISLLNSSYPVFVDCVFNKDDSIINIQALQQHKNSKISFNNPVILNLNAKLLNDKLKILDASVNSYNGIFNSDLKNNISSSIKYIILTGEVINKESPEFKNIIMNFLKPTPVNFNHYITKITGNIAINGKLNKPEIVGNIKIPVFSDKYGGLVAKNILLSITKNIINFDCHNVKIFNNVLSLLGTADIRQNNHIKVKTINIKSKELDLDNLAISLLASNDIFNYIDVEKGSLFCETFKIKSIIDELCLSDLSSDFILKNSQLQSNSMSANLYNGKVVGAYVLDTITGKYKANIQGRGLSSGAIMKSITNLKEYIAGKLDFDMYINSSIKSKYIKQAKIKFIIKDGQMSTFGKLEHLLYAQNIIADNMLRTSIAVVGRAIASKDTGLFKYLNGILVINDNFVHINSIKMLGPNMSLYITGNYQLNNNIANLNILGSLSDTIISSLGSFGTFTMDKFRIAISGNDNDEIKLIQAGVENIPLLPQRNTKEFKAIISGAAEAKSSVKSFMWISRTEKEYRTKEVNLNESNNPLPKFIENLPY